LVDISDFVPSLKNNILVLEAFSAIKTISSVCQIRVILIRVYPTISYESEEEGGDPVHMNSHNFPSGITQDLFAGEHTAEALLELLLQMM
jgi:hypothetical protein